MNVCISVLGRFWAFEMASQFQKRGMLQRLITSYPKSAVKRFGIARDKVVSLLPFEVVNRAAARFVPRSVFDHQYLIHEAYDRTSSRFIGDADVFVGWSGFSECGLRRARRNGARTVLERGSTHIEYQRDIMREEGERHGVRADLPHPRVVDKELREYELCDRICVPSEFVRRTFLEKGLSPERVVKNPYGVDLTRFHPVPKEDDTFRILFVGGASLRKGVHYLLQAFAELRLPDAELWLVGGKSAGIEPFFQKYEGTFRFFGPMPQEKLSWYYSQCSAFALCSIEEGLALVQAQAMACGLPLIATPNTGCEELITGGVEGFVVPARDVASIQERILCLYRDRDLCRQMGQAARLRVGQGLSWDDYGDRLMGVVSGIG